MKQHLVAFGGTAQDFSAGLVTVPFIADGLIRASSNVMQLNDNWDIGWTFAGGIGLSRVRVNSAQSRIRGYPNLWPIQATSTGGDNPTINDIRNNPIKLYNGENVTLQATNGAANIVAIFLSLTEPGNTYAPPPPGARRVLFTAAPTSVAFGWSQAANVVLDDDLEAGIYEVHDVQAYEATTLAVRLVFKDQVEKPGNVAGQLATNKPYPPFTRGMGKLGEFYSLVPPFIEVFANAAAAIAVVGYLTINKVR